MEMTEAFLKELRQARESLDETRKAMDSRANTANGNTVTYHISAGGIGVRICVGVCIFLLACNLAIGFAYLDLKGEVRKLESDLDDMDDYLAAIYMQAPHLRPKEKTK